MLVCECLRTLSAPRCLLTSGKQTTSYPECSSMDRAILGSKGRSLSHSIISSSMHFCLCPSCSHLHDNPHPITRVRMVIEDCPSDAVDKNLPTRLDP